MNEHCEPEISSIITARLENIIEDTLYIQVLCKLIIIYCLSCRIFTFGKIKAFNLFNFSWH